METSPKARVGGTAAASAACIAAALIAALLAALAAAAPASAQAGRWIALPDTAAVIPREECGFAQAGGRFYLLGGRGKPAVQEYQPATRTWRSLKPPPVTLNHFQAVTYAGIVYVLGAFDESLGGYPNETPAAHVHIYDPLSDTWVKGPAVPEARRRGSAGLVEYDHNLYVVLGNRNGHSGPGAPWLDRFDPATNVWTPLPDAPRYRDHFQAAVADGRLYAMGGRQSAAGRAHFTNLEKVDVFDFKAGAWSTLPSPASDLKVRRSGAVVATLGEDILFAGGSNPDVETRGAYALADAFDTRTGTWRSLAPMNRGRQVTGGFVNNSGLYVVSGSGGTGGSPILRSMEVFFPADSLPPAGAPLVAGALAPPGGSCNFGMVPAGTVARQAVVLEHASGNQGVLVAGARVVGDTAFKLPAPVTAPFLVRPGGVGRFEVSFASGGAVPAATHLEITLAVPPGATVKVPLEANRTGAALRAAVATAGPGTPVRYWDGIWYYRERARLGGPGREQPARAARGPVYRNALGRAP